MPRIRHTLLDFKFQSFNGITIFDDSSCCKRAARILFDFYGRMKLTMGPRPWSSLSQQQEAGVAFLFLAHFTYLDY